MIALVSRIRRGRSWAKEAAELGWSPQPKHDHQRNRVFSKDSSHGY